MELRDGNPHGQRRFQIGGPRDPHGELRHRGRFAHAASGHRVVGSYFPGRPGWGGWAGRLAGSPATYLPAHRRSSSRARFVPGFADWWAEFENRPGELRRDTANRNSFTTDWQPMATEFGNWSRQKSASTPAVPEFWYASFCVKMLRPAPIHEDPVPREARGAPLRR